jgi:hypothetical protein
MAVNIYMENAFDKMEWNGMFCWLFFINLDSIRFGSTRFDYVSLHLHFRFYSMVTPLVYFHLHRVSDKVIRSHIFSSLLVLKLFPACFIVVFVVSK